MTEHLRPDKIGVVMATRTEARPLLTDNPARRVAKWPFTTYQIDFPEKSTLLVISGMGKVSAALATQRLLMTNPDISLVVNAGICGALTDAPELTVGSVFRIGSVSEGPPGPGTLKKNIACQTGFWPDLPETSLVTRERPVFNDDKRRLLAKWGDLVDMEGAAVARTAKLFDLPVVLIKGVSDFAKTNEQSVLHENMEIVMKKIVDHLLSGLRTT